MAELSQPPPSTSPPPPASLRPGDAPRSLPPESVRPPKRKLRNLLLDARFQLKYTSMVVVVNLTVATVLGYFAYDYSQGQTEMLTVQMVNQPSLDPEAAASIEEMAANEDREVLTWIIVGIAILTLAIACTGIVVTHRLVGPAYKLKRLFRLVSQGHLRVQGKLRRGDELQDVFESFAEMVDSLRRRQADDLVQLDRAIAEARAAGATDAVLREVLAFRERWGATRDENTMRL